MREGLHELHIFAHPAYVLCSLTLHHLYFRSSVLEKVKQNVEVAQEKQKADYNKKHANPSVYAIGSIVLVKDFTCKKWKEGKLDFRWLGPYYIMRNLGKGSYLLQEESTMQEKNVNGAHIKPFSFIACDTGEKSQIQPPEKKLQIFYLFAPPIHEAVVVERTVTYLQSLYHHQPHVSLLGTAAITVPMFYLFLPPNPLQLKCQVKPQNPLNVTSMDDDVSTMAPVISPLTNDKCPVVSDQTSSTAKSLPSSNPIGSPMSSDFQRKFRHAAAIKNKNEAPPENYICKA